MIVRVRRPVLALSFSSVVRRPCLQGAPLRSSCKSRPSFPALGVPHPPRGSHRLAPTYAARKATGRILKWMQPKRLPSVRR